MKSICTGGFRGGGRDVRPPKKTNKHKKNNKWRRKKTERKREREERFSLLPQIIIITCKSILIFLHHTFHKHLRQ